ncbi:type II toxin-antitoxin system VapC family toxin [Caldivirga sp. UBA161]|uniref:type II toxin-antitoxin system VapC family toxin n=1 Tax=Caldivirga sp. UBA161 TaxID=1915569 RepID=UPI0025C2A13D|nr:type II toxin-antitoxin system VapC family toxin [Caldivirga sp. UBA161]
MHYLVVSIKGVTPKTPETPPIKGQEGGRNGITIYDALYTALAVGEGLPFLMLDDKWSEVAKRLGISVIIPHSIT